MSERLPKTESQLVDYVRSIDVRAPQELHSKIEALVAERTPIPHRRPAVIGRRLAGGFALAAIVAALVVGLAGGGGGSGGSGPTLREALALTLRPATTTAPAESPHNGTQLAAAVDGVAFPYWGERFGWRSSGARSDRVGGRTVTTVFYTNRQEQRIGYAIVAGTPPPPVSGGVVSWRHGTPFRLLSADGSQVVTWQRDGHLCVVAGRDVSGHALLALASWQEHDTLAS